MSNITKFDYDGTTISFEFSDQQKMINATEMAKLVWPPIIPTLLQSLKNKHDSCRIFVKANKSQRRLLDRWLREGSPRGCSPFFYSSSGH